MSTATGTKGNIQTGGGIKTKIVSLTAIRKSLANCLQILKYRISRQVQSLLKSQKLN
jgi:hypothetical protein